MNIERETRGGREARTFGARLAVESLKERVIHRASSWLGGERTFGGWQNGEKSTSVKVFHPFDESQTVDPARCTSFHHMDGCASKSATVKSPRRAFLSAAWRWGAGRIARAAARRRFSRRAMFFAIARPDGAFAG